MTTAAIAAAILEKAGQMEILSPALPVFFAATLSKPPNKPKYLWVELLPNASDRPSVAFDGAIEHPGILQVAVYWQNATGMIEPLRAADEVRAHFFQGLVIWGAGFRVEFNNPASVAGSIQDSAWQHIPVTVPYSAIQTS